MMVGDWSWRGGGGWKGSDVLLSIVEMVSYSVSSGGVGTVGLLQGFFLGGVYEFFWLALVLL
jgi:hypothetical protein